MSFRYLQFIHTGQTRSVCQSHLAKCVQRGGTVRLSLKPWRNVLAFHCPWIIPSTYSTKEHKSALCTQSFPLQQRLSTAVIEKREGGFTANLKQDCSLLLVNTISSSLHYSATFILFLSLSLSFSRGKKKKKTWFIHIFKFCTRSIRQEHFLVFCIPGTPSVGILCVFAWLCVCFIFILAWSFKKTTTRC